MSKKPTTFFDGIKIVPASSPTLSDQGTIGYDSSDDKLKVKGASTTDAVVEEAKTQTLTNKTLTSPAITTPTGIVKGDVGLGNVDNTSDTTKNAAAVTLTNKTIDAANNTISNISNTEIKAAAAIAVNKLAALTASRAVISDGSGFLTQSAVTSTELAHLSGVTSDLLGKDQTGTLTNKTLTAPVVNSPTGIVKGDVGLGNVDNTSDATKNSAVATLTNKTIDAASNTISNISNTEIKALAAIARSKIAAGTAHGVVSNDSSGNLTSIAPSTANNVLKSDGTDWISGTVTVPNTSTVAKTANYTATSTDDTILCSGSAFTITLPAAASNTGKIFKIKKTDSALANIITIDGNTSETIDGSLTTTLNTSNEAIEIQCDGTGWNILSRTIPSSWSGSYTPTGAWTTNTTYSAKWKREGSNCRFRVKISLTGSPQAATDATVTYLPSGMSAVDTSAMVSTSGLPILGSADVQASSNHYFAWVVYSSSTVVKLLAIAGANTNTHNGVFVSTSSPSAYASGDYVDMEFTIPITGWSG